MYLSIETFMCCSDKSQALSSADSRYEFFHLNILLASTLIVERNLCCKCFVNSLKALKAVLLSRIKARGQGQGLVNWSLRIF